MTTKLRELIRSVRACKTAAEERAVIAKECALIRTSFKSTDHPFRHRNVAKLLYIHMLGYPTHFGQMEALKLIAAASFPEKRIGYLALMILLDERQQVLMLVTNSLKTDFSHKNPYIVGLALCALANICSTDMARDLANEVEKFFRHQNAYIRKKAALCAIRIIRKVPELTEEFSTSVQTLLNDKNHAVLLTACKLMIELLHIEPALLPSYRKLVPTVVRLLKNLVLAGYVSEYDVVGITDPFLQGTLIHLLRLLGTGDREASDFMNDILAQVAINTEPTKNPGNAILYECVMTIMSIEAEGGLRVLAVNILGRFLTNRDNNIRYVALQTLCKCVSRDTQAIQRHRNTIVDCLKDADISIRRRALDLIYALVTKNNVKALVKELLNYLSLTSGDLEFKADLTEKICLVVERFAPSKHWHIDTIIQVLQTAGNFTRENVATDLILLIARTPALQPYAVYKLWNALYKKSKHAQLPLVHVVTWCIGEYGDMLCSNEGLEKASAVDSKATFTSVTETQVVDLLYKIIKNPLSQVVSKEYVLNALIKLTGRFSREQERLKQYINLYSTSMHVELQQRSCEYGALASDSLAKLRNGIVGRMPVPTKNKKKDGDEESKSNAANEHSESEQSEEEEEESESEQEEETTTAATEAEKKATEIPKSNGVKKQPAPDNLFDLDIFGSVPQVPAAASQSNQFNNFNTTAPPAGSTSTTTATPSSQSASLDLLDLFANPSPASATATTPSFTTPSPVTVTSSPFGGAGALLDFGAPVVSTPTPQINNFFDPLGSAPAPAPVTTPSNGAVGVAASQFPPQIVFESKGLTIQFSYSRPPTTPEITHVTASFSNSSGIDFTNFDFQVAVLKNVILTMEPASSTVIPANSHNVVTQKLTLNNTLHGKKKLLIRVKIDYKVSGQPVTETAQIDRFPA